MQICIYIDQSDISSQHVLCFNNWRFGGLIADLSVENMTPYQMSLDVSVLYCMAIIYKRSKKTYMYLTVLHMK
jgi:hypothetical protein